MHTIYRRRFSIILSSLYLGVVLFSGCSAPLQGSTESSLTTVSAEYAHVEATAVATRPADIDLRRVFEDLGPQATSWYQHVQTLSNPFFEGRVPESRGHELAAEYIEMYFRDAGLQPAFPLSDGSNNQLVTYRQPFTFVPWRTDDPKECQGANIGGILPGRGANADQWIVIGAHYDHVGRGKLGGVRRSSSNIGKLHPGADDNASGVAGVLVLADALSEHYSLADRSASLRSILFLCFDAEEFGLHGSRYFVQNPTIPLATTSLIINLDMIGRLRDQELMIFGAGTGTGLENILKKHGEPLGLDLTLYSRGTGSSDEANFQRSEIPGLHVFTGMTPEYTSPADQAYTLNPRGAATIMQLVESVTLDISAQSEKVAFIAPSRDGDRNPARQRPKVRLGVRLAQAEAGSTGIPIRTVSEGSSASDAGLQAGDVLLIWNGEELNSMRDLFTQLRKHNPGDVVQITVRRDEELLKLPVTLKAPNEGESRRRTG